MSEHTVNIAWNNQPHAEIDGEYSRNHVLNVDGKQQLGLSAAADFLGDPGMADPEQILTGSVSSCHMLFFLAIAQIRGFSVASYEDEATAILGKDDTGLWLLPKSSYALKSPSCMPYPAPKYWIASTMVPTKGVLLLTR